MTGVLRKYEIICDTNRRDPDIVLGNRSTSFSKAKTDHRIGPRYRLRHRSDLADCTERINFSQVLLPSPGPLGTKAEFSDHNDWKPSLVGPGEKFINWHLAIQQGDGMVRV